MQRARLHDHLLQLVGGVAVEGFGRRDERRGQRPLGHGPEVHGGEESLLSEGGGGGTAGGGAEAEKALQASGEKR